MIFLICPPELSRVISTQSPRHGPSDRRRVLTQLLSGWDPSSGCPSLLSARLANHTRMERVAPTRCVTAREPANLLWPLEETHGSFQILFGFIIFFQLGQGEGEDWIDDKEMIPFVPQRQLFILLWLTKTLTNISLILWTQFVIKLPALLLLLLFFCIIISHCAPCPGYSLLWGNDGLIVQKGAVELKVRVCSNLSQINGKAETYLSVSYRLL